MCHRLLGGAAPSTADAASHPVYGEAPVREALGITSYVGVPVHGPEGQVVATLCGIDRSGVPVRDDALDVLRGLADVLAARLGPLVEERLVIRRAPQGGWEVEGQTADDLTSAMVLADLIGAELGAPGRPERVDGELDEVAKLRLSVRQLEHALAARVVVEQAIGVLTERQGSTPRDAFERLRKVARAREEPVAHRVGPVDRQALLDAGPGAVRLDPLEGEGVLGQPAEEHHLHVQQAGSRRQDGVDRWVVEPGKGHARSMARITLTRGGKGPLPAGGS
jgi:hypothetical protein